MEEPPFESSIGERDARALVRLLGEIASMPARHDDLRRKLMDALCGMVGADGWLWCRMDSSEGRPAGFRCLARGGPGAGCQDRHWQAMNELCLPYLGERSLVRMGKPEPDPGAGRSLQYFVCGWSAGCPSDSVEATGDMMVSLMRSGMGVWSGIGIYREGGLRGFDPLETRIARILLDELPWLHLGDLPDERMPGIDSLYPRHREVLELLCRGWSRKRISEQLGVSINTVHGYVKAVFKHFGVHSQAELISQTKAYGGSEA